MGYPGFSVQLQGYIISIFGASPISQHIFSAIIAIFLGAVFFVTLHDAPAPIIFFILLFLYSQGLLLNPTPNPGYLFDSFFILGLFSTIKCIRSQSTRYSILAGFLFAISFCCKQYGIFGLITFALILIGCLKIDNELKKFFIAICLILTAGLICYSYFGGLLMKRAYDSDGNFLNHAEILHKLFINAVLFLAPLFLSIGTIFAKNTSPKSTLSLAISSKYLIAMVFTFGITVFLYFYLTYGSDQLLNVFLEILIYAPRRINSYLVGVSFTGVSFLKCLLGLSFLCSLAVHAYFVNRNFVNLSLIASVSIFAIIFLFYQNLSNTPFYTVAYLGMLTLFFFRRDYVNCNCSLSLAISLTPLFLLLIPYPNYAYFIPIMAWVFVYHISNDSIVDKLSAYYAEKKYILRASSFIIVVIFLLKLTADVAAYPCYKFNELQFTSKDPLWGAAITEAEAVVDGSGQCTNYACRYLLLTSSKDLPIEMIIERPLSHD